MWTVRRASCLPLVALALLAACGADDADDASGPSSTIAVAANSPAPEPTDVSTPKRPRPTMIVAGDSIIYDVAPALVEALDPKAARVLPVVAPSLAADSSRVTLLRRIEAARPDLVVVMVGVWERAHVTESGFELFDPGFAGEYRSEALDPVLDGVTKSGARLLILGPPHLREASAERQIAELERIWVDFASEHRDVVAFVDADTWLNGGPVFTELQQKGTTTTRLRRIDGVHLCEEGARRIALGVLSVLSSELPDADPRPHVGWEQGAWTARFPDDECPPVS